MIRISHMLNLSNKFIRQINSKIIQTHPQINPKSYTIQFLSTKPLFNPPKRSLSFRYLKRASHEKLRQLDKIPANFELIYRSDMSSYIRAAQIAATLGAALICTIAVINYDQHNQFQIHAEGVELQNIFNSQNQLLFFGAGFILLNIAVMLLVNKFPVRIYFNLESRKYLGVIFGKLPPSKQIVEFTVGEVIHDPKTGILPWNEFEYRLKSGKQIILLDHYFRRPDDMNVMLGYTKL